MKKFIYLYLLSLSFLLLSCGRQNDFQTSISMNENWKFIREDIPGASEPGFDDSGWRTLDIPHDWSVEYPVNEDNISGTAGGFIESGVGWYRKNIQIPDDYATKAVYFQFEGIYRDAGIFINGKYAGGQKYGYGEFIINAGKFLEYGKENSIAIRVNNVPEPIDRWYHGSGIYRDVNMVVSNKVHIPIHGTFIRNEIFDSLDASVRIRTEIINENDAPVEIMLVNHVFHPEEGKTGVAATRKFILKSDTVIEQVLNIEIPDMWSPENPVLYELVTDILSANNTILDTYISRFGIRQAVFDPEQGFLLNWKKTIMKGVCIHHDLGATGSAFYPSLMRTRLLKLKECGVNAIRLSHNPHETELLDMCDEMGFLVMDELFDKWEKGWFDHPEDPVQFMDTWEKDAEMFIRRDRNHPSVVLWSAGNETMEQLQNPERGVEILKMIVKKFNEMDPSREVTCAMHPHGELPSRLIELTRVVSYNYQVEQFNHFRELYPEKVFVGSETKVFQEGEVEDYSSLDFSKNTWFMLNEKDAGQFIWTGIDYFGESRAWPDKGMKAGFISTDGFIKPYGQFTRSLYSDNEMVYISVLDPQKLQELNDFESWQKKWYGPPLSSHWNWQSDSVDLYIFTNSEKISLSLNGEELGKYNRSDFPGGVIHDRIPFEAGNLEAITESGNAKHELITAGRPVKITAAIRSYEPYNQTDGVVEVEVFISDSAGNICKRANLPVKAVFGEDIRFLGADNGNLADHTLHMLPERETLEGKCLFIFKKLNEKEAELSFQSPELEGLTIRL